MLRCVRFISGSFLSIPVWILLTSTVQAATITVTTNADNNNGCTLRSAVLSANSDTSVGGCAAGSGNDVINLAAIGGQTITLATGEGFGTLNIAESNVGETTTIEGAGVTINGAGATQLFVIDSPATLVRLNLAGGTTAGSGGAIALGLGNTLEIRDSILQSNISTSPNSNGGGGAIALATGTLIVKNSTFASNSATAAGGAIYAGSGANVELVNTTFSGNSAIEGGGIYAVLAQLEIAQSTFTGSQSDFGGALSSLTSTVVLANSILANTVGGDDCDATASTFTMTGVNLVESQGSCGLTHTDELLETDPMLGNLGLNGGPTGTHVPLGGSPVIDAGSDADIPMGLQFDQRGSGFLRLAGEQVDLGSVEVQDPEQTGPDYVVTVADDTDDGLCRAAPGACSLREALNFSNANADASTISFHSSLLSPAATITLAGTALPTVTTEIVVEGEGITVDGDGTSRLFVVGASGDLTLRRMTLANGFNSISGAGINVDGQLTLIDSTLTGNASGFGGAIYVFGGAVELVNSTLSGNSATTSGGGIYASSGTISMHQTTLSGNSSPNGAGVLNSESDFTLANSVLANSSGGGTDCLNFDGSFTMLGVNLVEDQGNCAIPGSPELIQGVDPQLGALADNGGPTATLLPAATSPIIDAGDDAVIPVGLDFDQRGAGFARIRGDRVDLGSIEYSDLVFLDGFETPPE